MVIILVEGEGSDGDDVQRAESHDGGGGGKAMGTPSHSPVAFMPIDIKKGLLSKIPWRLL